jgi:hypothetical protein
MSNKRKNELNKRNMNRLNRIIARTKLFSLGLDWYTYFDHRVMHSERIVRVLRQIILGIPSLNQEELFLLYASAWLHDIGYPVERILCHAELLGGGLKELASSLRSYYGYSLETQGLSHGELSGLFILKNRAEFDLDDAEAALLGKICLAHESRSLADSALPLKTYAKDIEVRVLLLASLLRLGDMLDLDLSFMMPLASSGSSATLRINPERNAIDVEIKTVRRDEIRKLGEEVKVGVEEFNFILSKYGIERIFTLQVSFPVFSDPFSRNQVLREMLNDASFQNLVDYTEAQEIRVKRALTLRGRTLGPYHNMFLNFKKWNSTSPIYSSDLSTGGGYMLVWNHKGIVIDPGYDYLWSFLKIFSIEDIDTVIITHDHPDHCNDVPKILNLLHETNIIKEQNHQRRIKINFCVSLGVHERCREMFNSEPDVLEQIVLPGEQIFLPRHGLFFKSTHTRHPEISGKDTGFGVRLVSRTLGRLDIGITGDTGYHPGLRRAFDGTRILIAHLGRVSDPRTRGFSDKHLSFPGIVTLVSRLSTVPDLVVVSEFGEETSGRRCEICERLEEHIHRQGRTVRCLPSERNMCIQLSPLKVGRADLNIYKTPARVRTFEDPLRGEIYYQ